MDNDGEAVSGADNWAGINHLRLGDGVTVDNVSVAGRSMLTGYLGSGDLLRYYDPNRPSILVIQQCTNDLAVNLTAASQLYQTIATPIVALAKRAGFYVVLETLLPRNDTNWTAAKEIQRQQYNIYVRANTAKRMSSTMSTVTCRLVR